MGKTMLNLQSDGKEVTSLSANDLLLATTDPAGTPDDAVIKATNLVQTLLDILSTTQGTTLYFNGTDWAALSPGTSGFALTTGGAGANPSWTPYNMLPDGYMINGTLSVAVASNNLTVAVKTKAGTDPSATDPVSVYIGGTKRSITAALSVTKNAGTNWCNVGSTELATKEVDYFVYLIWNTTPATDIVDIGFSRVPYGRVYSDFDGTSTNEKYLAQGNASAPTATDDVVNIGRFAATLSAGAGYTWTVPTFTNANLIHQPIFHTRWLSYAPVWTTITAGNGTSTGKYKVVDDVMFTRSVFEFGSTSAMGSGAVSVTIPFTTPTLTDILMGSGNVLDAGTTRFSVHVEVNSALNTLAIYLMDASGTYIGRVNFSSTAPMVWTTSDKLEANAWMPMR